MEFNYSPRNFFAQPDAYMDKEVTVGGWIRSIRDSRHWIYRTKRWN